MDRFERLFSPSRRRGKASPEILPAVSPQLQSPSKPLFPSPSFIRPTSQTMEPREEERRPRNPGCSPYRHLERARSSSPLKFLEDSISKNTVQKLPPTEALGQVAEEASEDCSSEPPLKSACSKHELVTKQQREPLHIDVATLVPRASLPSPILMPSPISPTSLAGALSLFDSSPRSPALPLFSGKEHCMPVLPRLNRFSTLNLPHLESPSASDSEDDDTTESVQQYHSPASLSTPNTFSFRGSFDSCADSVASSAPGKGELPETWCARPDAHIRSHETAAATSTKKLTSSVRNSMALWLATSKYSAGLTRPLFWEPTLDEFLGLQDDDVAESDELVLPEDIGHGPTPPPKDTPKISSQAGTSHGSIEIPKSAPTCTVHDGSDGSDIGPPRPPKDSSTAANESMPRRKPVPIHASALISTIATTFGFDEIYIMSFWPDDRKRRGRLLDFPLHLEQAISSKTPRRASKSKVAGQLLASYGIEGATGSWELPTDILAEALDTQEVWYEYQDATPPPQGLSHGFMCSFYGDCFPSSQPALDMVNRGIVFAAFHTQSKPIITSGAVSDRNLLLADLRLLAKVLVDETIKNL
ncbi:hypothetical protein Micbo1qcDRAFT_220118 [Microdochium bolleyi]|uniref:Uncharacterized protein n=1 Tax=Microdochium bolleyi TaxID=196109 RepID=A0A136IM31_9PEZI|nr:hypothetical protein Micbo1qcDRAFT_220118 [Microdochium bolleyi]